MINYVEFDHVVDTWKLIASWDIDPILQLDAVTMLIARNKHWNYENVCPVIWMHFDWRPHAFSFFLCELFPTLMSCFWMETETNRW